MTPSYRPTGTRVNDQQFWTITKSLNNPLDLLFEALLQSAHFSSSSSIHPQWLGESWYPVRSFRVERSEGVRSEIQGTECAAVGLEGTLSVRRRRTQRCNMWVLLATVSLMINACTSLPKGQAEMDVGMKERGIASWYGENFHGWVTANGEIYDMEALTGAHRTLPLGTVVRVTNGVNGERVRVRINDRGPYVNGRILDLSFAAARQLDMVDHGISAVQLEVIGYQGEEWLLTDERGGMTSWTLAPLEDGPRHSRGCLAGQHAGPVAAESSHR